MNETIRNRKKFVFHYRFFCCCLFVVVYFLLVALCTVVKSISFYIQLLFNWVRFNTEEYCAFICAALFKLYIGVFCVLLNFFLFFWKTSNFFELVNCRIVVLIKLSIFLLDLFILWDINFFFFVVNSFLETDCDVCEKSFVNKMIWT